jgi:hypothetical protein
MGTWRRGDQRDYDDGPADRRLDRGDIRGRRLPGAADGGGARERLVGNGIAHGGRGPHVRRRDVRPLDVQLRHLYDARGRRGDHLRGVVMQAGFVEERTKLHTVNIHCATTACPNHVRTTV